MGEFLEKAAEAVYAAMSSDDVPDKDNAKKYAKAVLEALKDPTRNMIIHGSKALVQRKFGCPPDDEIDAARIYRYMLDSAMR